MVMEIAVLEQKLMKSHFAAWLTCVKAYSLRDLGCRRWLYAQWASTADAAVGWALPGVRGCCRPRREDSRAIRGWGTTTWADWWWKEISISLLKNGNGIPLNQWECREIFFDGTTHLLTTIKARPRINGIDDLQDAQLKLLVKEKQTLPCIHSIQSKF